jgi:Fe-S cluster assembly iron-binding protein IscA
MQYGFTLDETQNEDDWDLEVSGVKVLGRQHERWLSTRRRN